MQGIGLAHTQAAQRARTLRNHVALCEPGNDPIKTSLPSQQHETFTMLGARNSDSLLANVT